jgi:hypothetical protein
LRCCGRSEFGRETSCEAIHQLHGVEWIHCKMVASFI